MPVILTPPAGATIPTKRVTPEEWDADPDSETYEYFEILTFLRQETLDTARKIATRQVRENGRARDELDVPSYFTELTGTQLKGWRLLGADGAPIAYTPEHVAALPWGVKSWLHDQILACSGSIPTRDLVVRTEGGQTLTFRRTDDVVGAG